MNRLTFTFFLVASTIMASGLDPLVRTNYVVIGAFKNHNNAIHFTEAARANHMEANYSLNKVRQLYYVYSLYTEEVDRAVAEVLKLRASTEYTGAWVYQGVLGDDQTHDGVEVHTSWPAGNPPTTVLQTKTESAAPADATVPAKEEAKPVVVAAVMPEAGKALDPDAVTKLFIFSVYTHDKTPKKGNVEILDVDRQKKVSVVKANEPVVVKAINSSGDLRFDCQVAGYRKVTQTANFKNPGTSESGVTIENNAIVVPFELTRLKKGDKAILFNIYFYKDAALMRPESKYELDELLAMMNENSRYRIKLHGHTNGGGSGKLITLGESKNFFSLSGSTEGFGSAKQLSKERAELIIEYLASEGIAVDRMESKAWGGKKPIYDRDHAQASSNVRVEVEILQD